MNKLINIVWFKRDLRINDHARRLYQNQQGEEKDNIKTERLW